MATSYTRNLRLRLTAGLTGDALYNLQRIDDAVGALPFVSLNSAVLLRSKTDVTIEPESADVGGSGTHGVVNVGLASHVVDEVNLYATDVSFNNTASLKNLGGTHYTSLQAAPAVDTAASLLLDMTGGARKLTMAGNVNLTGDLNTIGAFPLSITLTGITAVTMPLTGTLATLAGVEVLTNKTINAAVINGGTATGTLFQSGTVTGSSLTSNAITLSSINSTPIGQTTPAAGAFTNFSAVAGAINGDIIVTQNAAQTLSRKNFSSSTFNGATNTFLNVPYSSLVLGNSITNNDVSPTAGIVYSKLNLTGSIVNADVSAAAQIAYNKLQLLNSIQNTDIKAGAGISYSKLALSNSIVDGDVAAGASIAYSKLALGSSILPSDLSPSFSIGKPQVNLTGQIVNADIAAAAAIAGTKIAPDFGIQNTITSGDMLVRANGHTEGFAAAPALGGNIVWKLPSSDGTVHQVMQTDGAGNLSWTNAGGTPALPLNNIEVGDNTGTPQNVATSSLGEILATVAGGLTIKSKGNVTSSTTGVTIAGSPTSAVLGSGISVDISTATALVPGLLSTADWSAFNAKASAFTPGSISTSTPSVTVGSGANSTVGPNVTVDIATATSLVPGLLSSSDWSVFNGKLDPNVPITAGTSTKVTYDTTGRITSGTTLSASDIPALDASKITTGVLNIAQIPPSAIERLVFVANQAARYALTTATVHNGDTVKQLDDNSMWIVINDTQLNLSAGYTVYTASTASSVPWLGVTGIPSYVTQAASATLDGYLTHTDWATFNSKQAALTPGNASTSTTGLTVTGTAVTVGPAITVNAATASAGGPGLLSAADWSTFNGKQGALTPGSISTSTSGVTVGSGSSSTVGPNVTVNIATASTLTSGLLSHTDWNTFNNKQNSLVPGNASTSTSGVTVLGTAVTVGPSLTIDVATADASHIGLLTAADWGTFNSKQANLGYTPAHNGANSDITSLSGLTTALSIAQGGTAGTTVLTAQQSLGTQPVFNGIEDASKFTLAYNAATRQFTVTYAAGAAITAGSTRYPKSGSDITTPHASTNGLWFCYYNASGVITVSQTPWNLLTQVPIATAYYTTSNNGGSAGGILSNELHAGVTGMDNATHLNLHTTRGTQLLSGIVASGYTLNTNGLANTSYALSAGSVADEDLVLATTAQLQGGANTYRVMWQTGAQATPAWNWIDDAEGGIYSDGTNIYWNQNNAGTWQKTAISANAFVNYWVVATTAYGVPQVVVLMGQATYGSQALASAATFASEMSNLSLLTAEAVVVYQMTYGRNASYGAPGNIRLLAVARVTQSQTSVAAGTSTNAANVSVVTTSFTGRLGIGDTNVQQALQDLDVNVTPITLGGTGASTAPQALINLGAQPSTGPSNRYVVALSWTGVGPYTMTIAGATHLMGVNPLVQVRETVAGISNNVLVDVAVADASGDFTITSNAAIVGKVIVS